MPVPDGSGNVKPKITVESISVPVVSLSLCNATFNNVIKPSTGSNLVLKLRFNSSEPLSQYKIDVHNNFDCHTHARMEASPWRLLKIVTLSGTDMSVTETIKVPNDASAGNYHFMINCIDAKGNEADFVEYNVIVVNSVDSSPPTLSFSIPNVDTVFFTKGSVITFSGIVTDNLSLKNGVVEISYKNPSGTQFDVIQTQMGNKTQASYLLYETYTLPSNLSIGIYKFIIKVYDEANNATEKYVWVNVI